MGRNGKVDYRELIKIRDKLEKNFIGKERELFIDSCAKELAARLLAKVIKKTPVGDYSKEVTVTAKRDSKKHKKGETYTKKVSPNGKKGGTLRRGWTGGKKSNADIFAQGLKVHHYGGVYVIEIENPTEYASYVEYGHRTRNGGGIGWVEGKFMLTISEEEVRRSAPRVLENKMKEKLGGIFK